MTIKNANLITFLFALILLAISCTNDQPVLNDGIIMMVDSIPYRSSIFERRYSIGGTSPVVTEDDIRNYLDETIKPELLYVKGAYENGIDKRTRISQKLENFKKETIEKAHPILDQDILISEKSIHNFYENSRNLFNFGILATKSFKTSTQLVDDYKSGVLQVNDYIPDLEKNQRPMFPSYTLFEKVEYGTQLPPNIFDELVHMKDGEISQPINMGGVWGSIIFINKQENKKLRSFDLEKDDIQKKATFMYRIKAVESYKKELMTKFNVKINNWNKIEILKYYDEEKNSINYPDNVQVFSIYECEKFKITNQDVMDFYNHLNPFAMTKPSLLSEQDLDVVANRLLDINLLYFDALEIGVQKDPLIIDQIINRKQIELRNTFIRENFGKIEKGLSEEELLHYYQANRDKYSGDYEKMKKNVMDDLYMYKINLKKETTLADLEKRAKIFYNENEIKKFSKLFSKNK
ncbi:MAG: peptidyl-prolyl cis-trans isomerase [Candidatus Marinimicrobia bacterium]|nr:peptidyl-prolyl cis-trans isomerase [Candidatus Neomarinimicrobiota bacterium]